MPRFKRRALTLRSYSQLLQFKRGSENILNLRDGDDLFRVQLPDQGPFILDSGVAETIEALEFTDLLRDVDGSDLVETAALLLPRLNRKEPEEERLEPVEVKEVVEILELPALLDVVSVLWTLSVSLMIRY
ncbi:MAG TPA: hypothetical protein VFE98_08640 [Candidatus Bathyarchaeia archaeon]|nr:hypothetical protein [Candidatus Bathyarchaeia archaeon]